MDRPSPPSVLIVEDEMVIALDLRLLVEAMGLTVSGVADGRRQAVEAARACPPDLILADVRLRNDQDGIEMVREILSFAPAGVIFVTANPATLAERGMGHVPTLVKPFDYRSLERAVRTALAGRQARPDTGGEGTPRARSPVFPNV